MPLFDQRNQRVSKQINVAVSATVNYSGNPSAPLLALATGELFSALPNFPRVEVRYIERPDSDGRYKALVNGKRLIISGRTGTGKTREAIELIQRLEAEHGEPFVVLTIQNFGPVDEMESPTASRNALLFLDDCHLLASRYAVHARSTGTSFDFNSWLLRVTQWLEAAYLSRFWIVGTMRDEPGISDDLDLDHPVWQGFVSNSLEPLPPTLIRQAIDAVSAAFQVTVDEEAATSMTQRCDGTFMSLIAYFQRKTRMGITKISEPVVTDFIGSYPLIWKTDYNSFINPDPAFRAIFESLSLLRQVGIFPIQDIVLRVAASLAPKVRAQRLLAAVGSLSTWISVEQVEFQGEPSIALRCPDAYIQDLADINDSSLRAPFARCLFNLYYKKSKTLHLPETAEEQIKDAIGFFPDELTAPMIALMLKPGLYDELPGIALQLAVWRASEAVPSFRKRFSRLIFLARRNTDSEWVYHLLAEMAICLAHIGDPRALPVIFEMLSEIPGGTLWGDLAETLPTFQDRESLNMIIDHVAQWPEFQKGVLAELCLGYTALSDPISEDEQQERDELDSDDRYESDAPDMRPLVEQAVTSNAVRVRFRGHLAAYLLGADAADILTVGLHDQSPNIRGACVMMLSRLVSPEYLASFRDDFLEDFGIYDGLTIRTIFEQTRVTEQAASQDESGGTAGDRAARRNSRPPLIPEHRRQPDRPRVDDLPAEPPASWLATHGDGGARVLLASLHDDGPQRVPAAVGLAQLGLTTAPVLDALYSHLYDRDMYSVAARKQCVRAIVGLAAADSRVIQSLITALRGPASFDLVEAVADCHLRDAQVAEVLRQMADEMTMLPDFMYVAYVRAMHSVGGVDGGLKRELLARLSRVSDISDARALARMIVELCIGPDETADALHQALKFRRIGPWKKIVQRSPGNASALGIVGMLGLNSREWVDLLRQGLQAGYAEPCIESIAELGVADARTISQLRRICDERSRRHRKVRGHPQATFMAAIALLSIGEVNENVLAKIATGPLQRLDPDPMTTVRRVIQASGAARRELCALITKQSPGSGLPGFKGLLLQDAGWADNTVLDYLANLASNSEEFADVVTSVRALRRLGVSIEGIERLLLPRMMDASTPYQTDLITALWSLGSSSETVRDAILSLLSMSGRDKLAALEALVERPSGERAVADALAAQFLAEKDELAMIYLAKAIAAIS
jgi:hypothetical protein